MTFSLTARCPATGAFGIAISSSSVCVTARCAWAGPMGAVATQNLTDPALGPAGLALLRRGLGAGAVLALLREGTPGPEHRQIGVVDRYGTCAHHSGTGALPRAAVEARPGRLAMGNLLASEAVPRAMADAFDAAEAEPLAERLMRGLEAGLEAGGEGEPVRAAGLIVAERHDWLVVDLRVDWDEEPIARLRALWTLYAPQRAAFEARAADPGRAPGF